MMGAISKSSVLMKGHCAQWSKPALRANTESTAQCFLHEANSHSELKSADDLLVWKSGRGETGNRSPKQKSQVLLSQRSDCSSVEHSMLLRGRALAQWLR